MVAPKSLLAVGSWTTTKNEKWLRKIFLAIDSSIFNGFWWNKRQMIDNLKIIDSKSSEFGKYDVQISKTWENIFNLPWSWRNPQKTSYFVTKSVTFAGLFWDFWCLNASVTLSIVFRDIWCQEDYDFGWNLTSFCHALICNFWPGFFMRLLGAKKTWNSAETWLHR